MSETDDIRKIKDRLNAFEAECPGFDELFRDEVPGEARLRNTIQSKLLSYEATAPSYEALMEKGKAVVVPFRKRLVPVWSVVAAAVACLVFLIFMPDKTKMDFEAISLLKESSSKQIRSIKPKQEIQVGNEFLTQKLETPSTINKIAIATEKGTNAGNLTSKNSVNEDTINQDNLTKISPSSYSTLSVSNGNNIESVYAQARVNKKSRKKDKILAGLNINGANRLLSFVNTKGSSAYPTETTVRDYSDGMHWLTGASNTKTTLRSATVSENDWERPSGNSYFSSVSNYKASYSLPINAGLSLSIPLLHFLEIQTGLTYTYLSATTSGESGTSSFNLHQELHYLGVPLRLAIKVHENNRFGLYASFGGSIEKGLVGKQLFTVTKPDGSTDDWRSRQEVHGIQPVLSAQLGVSYEILPSILLYVEPGANYYPDSDQPISSRTEEPFNLNIGFGLRYRLK